MAELPLDPWPDPSTPAGVAFFANAKAVVSLLKAQWIAPPITIAALAIGERETGLDPNAKGDYVDDAGRQLKWSPHPVGAPTSFGLWQHKKLRLDVIKANIGLDLEAAVLAGANTIENDIIAALWEFRNTPRYGWPALLSMTTAYAAARQWCASFEQAGAPDALSLSGRMAIRWYDNRALVGLQ
jgi:hypothetical protein